MVTNEKTKITYPYARLTGMKDLMAFIQEPGWKPSNIDPALIKKLAIAKGKEREAIRTIRFLNIIDEEGSPTEIFDQLKLDYQPTLKQLVEEKYAELFKMIPTRMMNQQRLVNFFDTSADTAEYQAKLFVWLCEQAGINLENVEKRFHRARFDKKIENQTE